MGRMRIIVTDGDSQDTFHVTYSASNRLSHISTGTVDVFHVISQTLNMKTIDFAFPY
jgi:hypothetical protein